VVISTDYVRAYPEQLRRFIDRPLTVLGTDGYGRSDSRAVLRRFFRVDRHHVVAAALGSLAGLGQLPPAKVHEALQKYGIDREAPSGVRG
jgi:pyruvate dehydrogenase E1 component